MEGDLQRVGKFNSARDEVLYTMTLEGWANESSGSIESPSGYFAKIINREVELVEIQDAFEADLERTGVTPAELLGRFLLVENEVGFVSVRDYPAIVALDKEYEALERVYSSWLGDGDGE